MPVIGGLGVVVPDDLIEPADEIAHVLRVHCSVFHEGQRLGVAVHAHQQAQPVLPHRPDAGLGRPVLHVHAGVPVAAAGHVVFQLVRFVGQFRSRFSVEFDHQDRAGSALDERHI